ncbi:glycosyl transferase [Acidihalobacter aeolianus]|uniref:Glycosyl transferase n=1 Tax=Acidihalobacter aeolianus TaxID=2792603 RepID=A0A1D8KBY7_9GAMM|nr:glycosyl transferase [Acidihalobacter aeolianus]
MRSMPYTGGLMMVKRSFMSRLGGFDPALEGVEEYDLMLRAWELGGDEAIGHVAGALYGRRQQSSYAAKPLDALIENGRRTLAAHLGRLGIEAEVENGSLPMTYRVRYQHAPRPMVSIIIPTRDQQPVLQRCLESLLSLTAYPNYEILVVDNGSIAADAIEYIDGLRALEGDLGGRLRIVDYPEAFNFSAMNNRAAAEARGDYLLLLNNDTAVLHAEWLDEMMAHAQREDVGAVGAKLLFPDGKIQHAGVLLGVKGPAEHPFINQDPKSPGYYARLQVDQDYSAVTGACLLVRKVLYDEVGGLDAAELAVSYSDIDLCLKIRALGKRVVWTPHAILMHEGSKSQQSGVEQAPDAAKLARFQREQACMYAHWLPQMANDPAYNRNLSLASTDFLVESDPALSWDSVWRPVPRILTQPADRMGCGEYRIIAPTRALIRAGLIQGQETDRIYTPPELARIKPDALVLQRQVEPFQIEAIERHKRFNPDVFCVFEIDDLVTNVPLKNVHRSLLPKDMYKRMRRAVAACGCLVVATEPLAEAYRDLASDIRIVPNFIESAVWGGFQPVRRMGKKPRVGWAGGVSHTGDLEIVAGVVEALKDEIDWVFFGMCPPSLRAYIKEYHEPVPIGEYPAKLASLNLDLAIAPLEDVPFNHAKSHLRLLEYGILGYPVVCSDLTPYQGSFPVMRVRNRFKDWVDAIRAHALDADVAALAGDRLRDHVREHWLLENNLDAWLAAWLP